MFAIKCLLIVAIAANAALASEEVAKAFKANAVVPDVIPTPPHHLLAVKYANKIQANLGNELTPTNVRAIPEISYKNAKSDELYTLLMVDPDAPSRKNPIRREFQHWIVVNIPGSDIKKGEVISEYVGSGPPKDTGLHRYVFLLYKQKSKLTVGEPHHSNTDGNRAKFSAQKFVDKYELGVPVAGNFFQAQYDDSVPALHKQLGF